MKRSWLQVLAICGLMAVPPAADAVVHGQVDDFEDGTTRAWTEGAVSPNPPVNVSDGGPGGAGDNYLRDTSTGTIGAGSRLTFFNQLQWTGDYPAAGVTRIEADMANFGATPLAMRIAIERNPGERYASTTAVPLPADGTWYHVVFDLTSADLTLVGGMAPLSDVLSDVQELRILSRAGSPGWEGDTIAAMLGVDNITAASATDCDDDGDVDLEDYRTFSECMFGPGGGMAEACECVDIDADEDVDLADFAGFQVAFTGAGL